MYCQFAVQRPGAGAKDLGWHEVCHSFNATSTVARVDVDAVM
jgi:hypothetical protein